MTAKRISADELEEATGAKVCRECGLFELTIERTLKEISFGGDSDVE